MSNARIDYDSGIFKTKVSAIASEVLTDLIDAGKKFEAIVDELEQVWTTDRGKDRVKNLRSAKANEFDSLIATVSRQDQQFAAVSKELYNIDQT